MINEGLEHEVVSLLSAGGEQLYWYKDFDKTLAAQTLEWVLDQYQNVIQADTVDSALDAFENTRVLCAIRSGLFGVNEVNHLITTRVMCQRDEREFVATAL